MSVPNVTTATVEELLYFAALEATRFQDVRAANQASYAALVQIVRDLVDERDELIQQLKDVRSILVAEGIDRPD